MRIKAMDLLFNGLTFECDGREFAAKAICNGLRSEGAQVKIVNETFLSVSMLGRVSQFFNDNLFELSEPFDGKAHLFSEYKFARKTSQQSVASQFSEEKRTAEIWVESLPLMKRGSKLCFDICRSCLNFN